MSKFTTKLKALVAVSYVLRVLLLIVIIIGQGRILLANFVSISILIATPFLIAYEVKSTPKEAPLPYQGFLLITLLTITLMTLLDILLIPAIVVQLFAFETITWVMITGALLQIGFLVMGFLLGVQAWKHMAKKKTSAPKKIIRFMWWTAFLGSIFAVGIFMMNGHLPEGSTILTIVIGQVIGILTAWITKEYLGTTERARRTFVNE